MPLVCLLFVIWYDKNNEIKAFEKESANLFILYSGNNPSRGKIAVWQEAPNQGTEN